MQAARTRDLLRIYSTSQSYRQKARGSSQVVLTLVYILHEW
jgi:hypothetical protein